MVDLRDVILRVSKLRLCKIWTLRFLCKWWMYKHIGLVRGVLLNRNTFTWPFWILLIMWILIAFGRLVEGAYSLKSWVIRVVCVWWADEFQGDYIFFLSMLKEVRMRPELSHDLQRFCWLFLRVNVKKKTDVADTVPASILIPQKIQLRLFSTLAVFWCACPLLKVVVL